MSPLSSVATTHHHPPPVCGEMCVRVCVCALHIPAVIAVVVWHVPHGPPLLRPNPTRGDGGGWWGVHFKSAGAARLI